MDVILSSGTGTGHTDLVAFDRALDGAGIANLNLIYLSSVIPAGTTIVHKTPELGFETWGHKAYVVLAQHRELAVGAEAWAGIGWVQDDEGAGLLVEHHGGSKMFV